MTTTAPATRVAGPAPATRTREVPWLALVALCYAAAQLLMAAPHLGLGWDETVYLSQTDAHRPSAFFSAPRSRGVSYLVAPLLAVTDSTSAVRIYLALLAALALWGAFALWGPLIGQRRTAGAALLFAGLWTTVLYGPQAMPNLWVGLGAVAAVGCLLRSLTRFRIRPLLGVGGAVAAVTLLRFSDGVWLVLPLLAACLLSRPLRRPGPLLAVAGGFVVGALQWLVEACLRFGGVRARLHASSATEGGMGLHWAGGDAWRSLNGPLLCRPCTAHLHHPALTLWWLALPLLAALVCLLAARRRDRLHTWLPVACAASMSVPYLLLLDYSAPRFLLPAYALLSPALTSLAPELLRRTRTPAAKRLVWGVGCVLLLLHLAGQALVLQHVQHRSVAVGRHYASVAARLRSHGLSAPCVVSGVQAPPIAYYADCASANVHGNNRDTTAGALRARARRTPTAALVAKGARRPHYTRGWHRRPLPGTGLTAYVGPAVPVDGRTPNRLQ